MARAQEKVTRRLLFSQTTNSDPHISYPHFLVDASNPHIITQHITFTFVITFSTLVTIKFMLECTSLVIIMFSVGEKLRKHFSRTLKSFSILLDLLTIDITILEFQSKYQ